jgi:hypothetical protein
MRVRSGESRAVMRHGRRGGFHGRCPRASARGFLYGSHLSLAHEALLGNNGEGGVAGAGVADQRSQDQSACGGSVPGGAQAASRERIAGKAEANVRRWGVGSPDQRHARGSSVKRIRPVNSRFNGPPARRAPSGRRPRCVHNAAAQRPRSPGGATAWPSGGRLHAPPRHPASRCWAGRRRLSIARPPGGPSPHNATTQRPRSPGGATAWPSGEPLAFAATAQGCRGHGWPDSREVRSHTTCRCRRGSACRTRTRTAGRIRRGTRTRSARAFRSALRARPSRSAHRRCLPSRAPAATCH